MSYPTIHEIQGVVSGAYRVPVLDILSQRRGRDVVRARHVAMWLCRHATLHSLPEIGRAFGDRDHSTVMHALRCVDQLMAQQRAASDIWALLDSVNNGQSVEIRRSMMRIMA